MPETPAGFKGTPPFKEGAKIKSEDILKAATQQAGQDLSDAANIQKLPADTEGPVKPSQQICPRCGWDQIHREIAQPSNADKQCFMRSILGRKRYEKEYSLIDNTLKVTFRALSPEETDLVLNQLRADGIPSDDPMLETTRTMSAMELLVAHNQYRMVCSLKRIDTGADKLDFDPVCPVSFTVITADEKQNEGDRTVLPSKLKDLMEKLGSEPLFNILLNQSQLFHREVDILVQRANDPDFWLTTAGPHSQ